MVTYMHIQKCAYANACVFVHIYIYMYLSLYICMYRCKDICIFICKYIYEYMYIYTYRFICIYTYIYTSGQIARNMPDHAAARVRILEQLKQRFIHTVSFRPADGAVLANNGLRARWSTGRVALLAANCKEHGARFVSHFSESSWSRCLEGTSSRSER